MARRKGVDSEDSDYSPRKKVKRPSKTAQSPTTTAAITILATDITPDRADARSRLDKIDGDALGRIRKALALASHEGTGEKEAKAALRMASKLMARYSVTQADVLSQETDAEKLQRAGTSVVSIRSTKEGGSVKYEKWASNLSQAMTRFFDCQCYTTAFKNGERLQFSFYGLAEQTVAAAYAMEMAYNLILAWCLAKVSTGVHKKNAYKTGVAQGLYKLAKQEKEEEKKKTVIREQKLLEQKRKEEEEEDYRRLERLKHPRNDEAEEYRPKFEPLDDDIDLNDPSPENTAEGKAKVESAVEGTNVKLEEVEDDDQPRLHAYADAETAFDIEHPASHVDPDGEDGIYGDMLATADFDDFDSDDNLDLDSAKPHIKQSPSPSISMPPPPPPLPPKPDVIEKDESQWASVNQLVAFRATSVAVGEEYLKSQGIKLGKRRAAGKLEIKDHEAREMYRQGVKDAKEIDVRGRRLKDAEQD